MRIMLIGGGSGGHITPLLAVAHEIKRRDSSHHIIGVCERGSKFTSLYSDSLDIDELIQVSAGKYRRYSNQGLISRFLDVKTNALNIRDIFKTAVGIFQSYRLLKKIRPDVMLVKGGFVAVPMGLAAAKLGIPYITHDSDSTPGLANRIVSRWAQLNMTGMSSDLYDYDKDKTRFVGIPMSTVFESVDDKLRLKYRKELSLPSSAIVVTVVGGSLGGHSLNMQVASLSNKLLEDDSIYILHVAGRGKDNITLQAYKSSLDEDKLRRVKVYDFAKDVYKLQGAANVVITRAGATQTAELSVQGLPIIIVPADLAGGHQDKNAHFFASKGAAYVVYPGDTVDTVVSPMGGEESTPQGITKSVKDIIYDSKIAEGLRVNIQKLAKPSATQEIADVILETGKNR